MNGEHINRSRLKQIIEQNLPIINGEHRHVRDCRECREQLVVMYRQFEDRQARRTSTHYFAPLAVLVVVLMVSLVFLAVILETW